MGLRTGHGNGAGQPRIEVLPADELPTPDPGETERNLAVRRQQGRPFEKGNKAAAGHKPKLALLGVGLEGADPAYAAALRRAGHYRRRRCAEIAVAFGYCSAGVSALIASAALALCASRFLYEQAAKTKDPETLKRASLLANDARQHELAAWELASREGVARKNARGPETTEELRQRLLQSKGDAK